MSDSISPSYSDIQTTAWIRGLVSLAWADGHFDKEEQDMITNLLHQDLTEQEQATALEPISPTELADGLGHDPNLAENFLRMAVMVAIADGDYSAKMTCCISTVRRWSYNPKPCNCCERPCRTWPRLSQPMVLNRRSPANYWPLPPELNTWMCCTQYGIGLTTWMCMTPRWPVCCAR